MYLKVLGDDADVAVLVIVVVIVIVLGAPVASGAS